jgi:hypothetical protein
MKILSSFLLFMALSLPSIAQVTNGEGDDSTVNLQLSLQAGDQYLYSVGMKQQIAQEVMGQSITIDQQITTDYAYKVLSNDGKLMKIEVTYQRILVNMDLPQKQIVYDSDSPGEGELAAVNALIGKPFHIYMTPQGDVTRVEGYDELTGGLPSAEMEAMFSDSSLMQSLDMNIYAGKPVGMGESWNIAKTMQMSTLTLQSDLTYTLEGSSEDLAWINVNGNISAVSNQDEYDMELSGTQEGTLETDIRTGMVSSGQLQLDIDAKIVAQGFEIPMNLQMEVTMSGKKL